MKKLAIVTSHPIQYNAPWFALLAKAGLVIPKVFYTWQESQFGNKYDPGFKRTIKWDVPLLDGYDYCFVKNTAPKPNSNHFKGLINPSLITEIESWKPDAILLFGWNFQSHLNCLRHFKGKITVLFRGDSTLLDETGILNKFLRRIFLKWVFSHIDFALYTGSCNRAYFLAHGLKAEQLKYAPHAVDNSRFSEPDLLYQQQALEMQARLGIQPEDLVLLFAGKLEKKKNPFFLLELMRRHKHPNLKLLIVGNGELEQQLKLGAQYDDRILFAGFQNQQKMPVVYRVGDIFLLPSVGPGETWGLALNEAMASGSAIAATLKVGGSIDLINPGENGDIIDLQDTSTLSGLIQSGLANKSVLKQMGQQSKHKVQEFSYEKIIQGIHELFQVL